MRLEDRLAPVANVLSNVPESNQATLTANFTQSRTAGVVFGNTVVVAYNDSGSGANRLTGYARSTDGGVTFTDLGALTGGTGEGGDPVMARNELTGRIYLATLSSFAVGAGVQVFRSDNNGLTFQGPSIAFAGLSNSILRQPSIAVDNAGGTGQGRVCVVARDFGASNAIQFTRSFDQGLTWSAPVNIVSGGQSPRVVVNADNSVNVFWFDNGTRTLLTRRAVDGGTFRSSITPVVAANPTQQGVFYVAYADNPAGADKADIFFTQSNDFAVTWSAPIRINTDATTRD